MTAAAGYDAIAHAVESFVCTKRTARSQALSLEAWRLLEANYERVLAAPDDLDARAAMQLGAFHAGTAIELSMLGATHACANPVTARYGTTHGHAIAILLPHVVRWNASVSRAVVRRTAALRTAHPSHRIAPMHPCTRRTCCSSRRAAFRAGRCRRSAADAPDAGASKGDLAALASEAAEQWTGTFNPRPFDAEGALEIYQCAF